MSLLADTIVGREERSFYKKPEAFVRDSKIKRDRNN